MYPILMGHIIGYLLLSSGYLRINIWWKASAQYIVVSLLLNYKKNSSLVMLLNYKKNSSLVMLLNYKKNSSLVMLLNYKGTKNNRGIVYFQM
jgi:hypothetical protein